MTLEWLTHTHRMAESQAESAGPVGDAPSLSPRICQRLRYTLCGATGLGIKVDSCLLFYNCFLLSI